MAAGRAECSEAPHYVGQATPCVGAIGGRQGETTGRTNRAAQPAARGGQYLGHGYLNWWESIADWGNRRGSRKHGSGRDRDAGHKCSSSGERCREQPGRDNGSHWSEWKRKQSARRTERTEQRDSPDFTG